jgi:hypothetical protein
LNPNWFEPPLDFNEEVVNMAVRAFQCQIRHAWVFRGGSMLGRTFMQSRDNIWTWKAKHRLFDDVLPLKTKVGTGLFDFLSRGVDKEFIDKNRIFASVVTSERIPHMVWQKKFSATDLRSVYFFANVSNSTETFTFHYLKGLDYSGNWKKTIRLFDGRDANGFQTVNGAVVQPKDSETLTLAPRSMAAVQISK